MRPLHALALRHDGTRLWVLDQTRLPHAETWVDGSRPEVMVDLIRRLAVRGAPLIGVAAALCAATHAAGGATETELIQALRDLRGARPTAVNLMWAVDRLAARLPEGPAALIGEAEAIFDQDVALCEAMASQGLALLGSGESVLTHCNAGALATVGIGTAVGVIQRGWEAGRIRHVFVDETRPLLQGGRLTAWEMKRLGIPHTLITDSMAALALRDGKVDRIFVGADRVAANGDFANKVGTYGLAIQARAHGIPFHPVAPWSTVDLACPDGAAIPIELRDEAEVRGFGSLQWAPPESPAWNPSFDVTPAHLITRMVLDRGTLDAAALQAGGLLRLA